jgi:hypothetical protein
VQNQHLVQKLIQNVGFRQSEINECIFYKGKAMYVLNTDNSILVGPDDKELNDIIRQIAEADLDITEEENALEYFLGVHITKTPE